MENEELRPTSVTSGDRAMDSLRRSSILPTRRSSARRLPVGSSAKSPASWQYAAQRGTSRQRPAFRIFFDVSTPYSCVSGAWVRLTIIHAAIRGFKACFMLEVGNEQPWSKKVGVREKVLSGKKKTMRMVMINNEMYCATTLSLTISLENIRRKYFKLKLY